MALAPRVVVVHRRSQLAELTERHATRGQVEFFLAQRGRSLADLEREEDEAVRALRTVGGAVPADWRRASVEREDLPQFMFTPDDIVVVVGRDGLVANVAKYVGVQPVIGVNPFPSSNAGVLTPVAPAHVAATVHAVVAGRAVHDARTMVTATADDGQSITALNDVFVGDEGHQSARYELALPDGYSEVQSSSGLVVGTGTGATGWLASLANDRGQAAILPGPRDPHLAWFVREAWPSRFTATNIIAGMLAPGQQLALTVHSEALVIFGDGIEADKVVAGHGQRIEVGVADRTLNLVVGTHR